jgi:hypothetical protein
MFCRSQKPTKKPFFRSAAKVQKWTNAPQQPGIRILCPRALKGFSALRAMHL